MNIEAFSITRDRPDALLRMERQALARALRGAGNGERLAFEEVYRLTSAKLFGVCLRLMPVRCEAEEVLQDVYCSVWRRAGSFDETRGTAMTWLLTLTRNAAIDRLRKKSAMMLVPIDCAGALADPALLPSDRMEGDDDKQRILFCIGQLDTQSASLIMAVFFEGRTYAELAQRSSLPLGTYQEPGPARAVEATRRSAIICRVGEARVDYSPIPRRTSTMPRARSAYRRAISKWIA